MKVNHKDCKPPEEHVSIITQEAERQKISAAKLDALPLGEVEEIARAAIELLQQGKLRRI